MSIKTWAAAAAISVASATSSFAATIDLGFGLDASGSVGSLNFATMKNGLADALANIPVIGGNEYRISVITFAETVTTVIAPVVVTAANLSGLQQLVRDANYTRGYTHTDLAIATLQSNFANAGGMNDTSIFNLSTDGEPYGQTGSRQSQTEMAALAAHNAGVDGISFEAIGNGLDALGRLNMARIAGLGTTGNEADADIVTDLNLIPNATERGFVIDVAGFSGYSAAIDAKIQQVVVDINEVPLPAGLPLLLAGVGAFGVMRVRAKAA